MQIQENLSFLDDSQQLLDGGDSKQSKLDVIMMLP